MSLEILKSDVLSDVSHGFFTRKGGVSKGIYEGLNCGVGSADDKDAVAANRAFVADAMGVEELATVHQIHSANVVTITANSDLSERPKADALVTAREGVALGILTADCQPVLFSDPVAGVIGAAHAGWRGAVDGVLEATIDAMEGIGANRANISAAIGPAISQSAYEVGPEFFEEFLSEDPNYSRFFAQGTGDRYQFDLPAFGLHRLREAGISSSEWIRHCTYSDPDRFYSYRRSTHLNEPDYGRLIAVIRR